MAPCLYCESLPFTELEWESEHYSTFTQLDDSAKNGCEICGIFRAVVLEYYACHRSGSIEEAEAYHRQLDREDAEIRSQAGSSHSSRDVDLSDDGQSDQSSEVTSFFAESVSLDTDAEFAPLSTGVYRIIYTRRAEGSMAIPVDELYPFVDVSSQLGKYGAFLLFLLRGRTTLSFCRQRCS